MSSSSKQSGIEELLRKSLLGEELINTQFHLFSARSTSSGRAIAPRVLCANNALLTESSKYFLDLLSSEGKPSDTSLIDIDIAENEKVPSGTPIDDYGYESDSDLDDEEQPEPVVSVEAPEGWHHNRAAHVHRPLASKEADQSDGASDSGASDTFVSSNGDEAGSNGGLLVDKERSETSAAATIIQNHHPSPETSAKKSANSDATRLRSLGSRHIFVKDTAFQTWYTLLSYLYTGKITFLPPTSSGARPKEYSMSLSEEPKCSAKSMYRLACKVGLGDLRNEALTSILSNLTEHNILRELSCRLLSSNPPLLEMELDILYKHIASPPVVMGLPALVKRIANKELLHGADIIVGLHSRILKEHYPSAPPKPQPIRVPSPVTIWREPVQGVPQEAEDPVDTPEPTDCFPTNGASEPSANGGVTRATDWGFGSSWSFPAAPPAVDVGQPKLKAGNKAKRNPKAGSKFNE
ncbi:hypothetical protein HYDPIDRAFT_118398 [Hydnomerulius pinastri MD-312]|uniref:BTB domain-containing protein n=1 Tax=Hydnomerulius pinastri MD-312 TaxID=994086 RepID=A0A0C9VPL2_9AGAM|nr:hypothetical protein HYDPIDRAFT_118398 [Hydnomerulius pinastri MD-312]